MSKIRSLIFLSIVLFVPFVLAGQQPGFLDPTFNNTGFAITSLGGSDDRAFDIKVQDDGKIVLGGSSYFNNKSNFALARYLSNGTIDSSFGNNGFVFTSIVPGQLDYLEELVLQNDGKIIAVGHTQDSLWNDIVVARYHSNGTLDSTFGTNGIFIKDFFNFDDIAYSADVSYPSKRIYLTGRTNSNDDYFIICLDSTGNLDVSFNNTGWVINDLGFTETLYSIKVLNDSIIYGAGNQIGFSGGELLTVRYFTTGSIDLSYNTTGYTLSNLGFLIGGFRICIVQNDHKLLAGGSVGNNGSTTDFIIARYLDNGLPDSSFNSNGYFIGSINGRDIVSDMIIQNDNNILVAGYTLTNTNQFDFVIKRFTSNGVPDITFGNNGTVTTNLNSGDDLIFGMDIQSDSKIVVCGESYLNNKWNFACARYFSGLETGINELNPKHNFKVYPNPNNGVFSIQTDQYFSDLILIIYDFPGKEILRTSISGVDRINIECFPDGSYIYSLLDSNTYVDQGIIIKY